LRLSANTKIHALDMALGIIHRRVWTKHRCKLKFHPHQSFTRASLSRVLLCVSSAFLVNPGMHQKGAKEAMPQLWPSLRN